MIKIKIYLEGKTKEKWLETALKEYEKRLSQTLSIEWKFVKDLRQIKESSYLCLDPLGKEFTSPEFASFLFEEAVKEGAKLTFVIGGPEGIPSEIRQKASHLVSFSKLTFTHQMVRLILLEQLYRSTQIQKNTRYHK